MVGRSCYGSGIDSNIPSSPLYHERLICGAIRARNIVLTNVITILKMDVCGAAAIVTMIDTFVSAAAPLWRMAK